MSPDTLGLIVGPGLLNQVPRVRFWVRDVFFLVVFFGFWGLVV